MKLKISEVIQGLGEPPWVNFLPVEPPSTESQRKCGPSEALEQKPVRNVEFY